jgi:hypothetical protein
MVESKFNGRYWRDRAEETRTKAASFRFSKQQQDKLLRVADEYEKLARQAEAWIAERPFSASHDHSPVGKNRDEGSRTAADGDSQERTRPTERDT